MKLIALSLCLCGIACEQATSTTAATGGSNPGTLPREAKNEPEKKATPKNEPKAVELTEHEKKMCFKLYYINLARGQVVAGDLHKIKFPPSILKSEQDAYREVAAEFKATVKKEHARFNGKVFSSWLTDAQLKSVVDEGTRNGWDSFEKIAIVDGEVAVVSEVNLRNLDAYADFMKAAEVFLSTKKGASFSK